jgi:hypothetical protein
MSTVVQISKKRKFGSSTGARIRRQRSSRSLVRSVPRVHPHVRSAYFGQSYIVGIDTRTGFTINGTSTGIFNMQFAFTLGGVVVSIGGVTNTTLPLPNYTEFTNLYDQYRIDWVEGKFSFSNNNSSNTSPGTTLPIMYLAKDYNDSKVAGVTDLQQYSTQTMWQLGNAQGRDGIKNISVKPNVDVGLYQGLTTGYGRGKPMFVDTSSPDVLHYGVKIAYDPINFPAASTLVGYLAVTFTYHMSLKNTR